MVEAAAGRPLILVNPLLQDKPSSNNKMQIRGRSERRTFQDSFVDVFALRLLYPSNGGYMFPIQGAIAKKDYRAPWVAYRLEVGEDGREEYKVVGVFPPHPPPDANVISSLFTGRK